jgi:hypothetical protein
VEYSIPARKTWRTLLLKWLTGLLSARTTVPPEIRQANEVIAAIDAGGMPLNPARINAIARSLGLEVSRKAPVEETIGRIRSALQRTNETCM